MSVLVECRDLMSGLALWNSKILVLRNSATNSNGVVLVKFRNPCIYNMAAVKKYKYSLQIEIHHGEAAARYRRTSLYKECNIVMLWWHCSTFICPSLSYMSVCHGSREEWKCVGRSSKGFNAFSLFRHPFLRRQGGRSIKLITHLNLVNGHKCPEES
jgi:hypothetical protein